jgi:hypothetical protein
MTIAGLILLELIGFEVVGPPVAYFFDDGGFFYNYLVRGRDIGLIFRSYIWMLYAIAVLVVLYWISIKRFALKYSQHPFTLEKYNRYYQMWFISVGLASICGVILFVQNGFKHPLLGAIGLSFEEFTVKRIGVSRAINMTIYNVGLHIFVAFAMVLSFFFIKKIWLSIITVIYFILFATFSLAKSPIIDTILELTFIYLLLKNISWKPLFVLLLSVILLGTFITISAKVNSFNIILISTLQRLFLGEFVDLPTYFEVFQTKHASILALLPPYIQSLFGINAMPPSRIVVEYSKGVSHLGLSGFVNTFFIGSAYAYFGMWGVLLSPLLVILNFYIVARIFTLLKKNIFTVFILGYLIFKLSHALFSDIGYFIFSSIQIILIIVLSVKVLKMIEEKLFRNKPMEMNHS